MRPTAISGMPSLPVHVAQMRVGGEQPLGCRDHQRRDEVAAEAEIVLVVDVAAARDQHVAGRCGPAARRRAQEALHRARVLQAVRELVVDVLDVHHQRGQAGVRAQRRQGSAEAASSPVVTIT